MKHKSFAAIFMSIVILGGCVEKTPRADHVVYMCFDAMSAIGIQRAVTPNFNYMIENGAVSIHTRCGLPSNSSPNWMTIASAAPFEMTGVLDNGVTPRNGTTVPALKNAVGFFPTIFESIREQKPDAKIYFFGESSWSTAMYDITPFDVMVPERGKRERLTADEALHRAADAFVSDRPDVMFIEIDVPDHEGLMENTVIVITADHGGFNFGHGGSTMAELEVPVIMYGGPVTKGKVMEHVNMNYDTPATVAGLLGVELPWECHGKFLKEAFEPKTDVCYVPVPLVHPFRGTVGAGEKVSITADTEGAEIHYTLDGSELRT
ncbi:MAG: alkaline phosphatase family protein [Alistipes sp.]|nr:alkaline phosphatase family protein [Candidatus Minthomonas equi]